MRDRKQCCEKINALKKKYKECVDRFHRSGVGIESDDDLEDHNIFVGFKWFEAVHSVMRTRAVVSPPALIDTASIGSRSNLTSPSLDDQLHLEDTYTEQVDTEEYTIVGSTSVLPVAGCIQSQSGQPGDSDNTAIKTLS